MLFGAEWEKFLWEGIVFLVFAVISGSLITRRFSKKASLLACGGTLLGIGLLQVALLACGWDKTLVLTLLPLTAYLPAIVCLHILSRSGFFQTVAAWTVSTIVYFVLKTIWKILMLWFTRLANLPGWGRSLLLTACLLLAAGGMLFLVFRFLRRPFRTYVLHNQTNWLLISFPVLMIILLFSYVGGSTTDNPPAGAFAADGLFHIPGACSGAGLGVDHRPAAGSRKGG